MVNVNVYCGLMISILCFGGSLAISDELKEMAQILHDSCIDEIGVDESLIIKARDGDFVEDGKLKCYMKCLLEQLSGMTDDGDIDVESVVGMLPDELQGAAPAVEKCGTVKGADDCETAFLTNKCWYNEVPDIYYVI